jgi:hypothetical protein
MSLLRRRANSEIVRIPSTEMTLLIACRTIGTRSVTSYNFKEVDALRARRTRWEDICSSWVVTREGDGTEDGMEAMISRVVFSTAFAAMEDDRLTFLTISVPEMFSSSLLTRQYANVNK